MALPVGAGLVRMRDASMAPRVPAGAWVVVDWRRTPQAGDVVLAVLDDELAVRSLVERDGRRWLVAARGPAVVPAGPDTEIRGVVIRVLPDAPAPAAPGGPGSVPARGWRGLPSPSQAGPSPGDPP